MSSYKARDQKDVIKVAQLVGNSEAPGATTVRVLLKDNAGDILMATGTTVPTDTETGYAKSCLFIKTNASTGTKGLYENQGTNTSCVFNAIGDITASEIGSSAVTEPKIAASAILDKLTIYNDTGGTLTKGTLVRIKGYSSTNGLTVVKADADTSIPATHVVTADISNATSGTVYSYYIVTGVNTAGQTIGDAVYLSATAGGFVFTAPSGADQLSQQVGTVKVVHASTGEIEFFPGASEYLQLGTSYLQNDAVTSAKLDESTIQYAAVSLSAAQILDLADTPVELVAAPGAGKVIEFVSAVLLLDHEGTGFAESDDNLSIRYTNEAGAAVSELIEMTGFIDQTADTMTIAMPDAGAATPIVAKTGCENQALVLCNMNDDFTDAGTTTSVLRVKVAYRVHATGW